METKIQIAVVDDHKLFRTSIINFLESKDYSITISIDDGLYLFEKPFSELFFDICILDLNMKRMNGYQTLKKLKAQNNEVRTLVLSVHNDRMLIDEVISLGANGYLCKLDTTFDEIEKAILSIYYSGFNFSADLSRRDVIKLKKKRLLISKIPNRELEFINFCSQNISYKEIASKMNVSIHTIETYRNNLFRRFNVHSKAELITILFRIGLLQ